jgi:hypothetical protein
MPIGVRRDRELAVIRCVRYALARCRRPQFDRPGRTPTGAIPVASWFSAAVASPWQLLQR